MKIIIVIDEITGEVFFYTLDEESKDSVFIQPRIKKKKGEAEKEDKTTH